MKIFSVSWILLLLIVMKVLAGDLVGWRGVDFDLSRINPNKKKVVQKIISFTGSVEANMQCAFSCSHESWCDLWCLEDSGNCQLLNLLVSPWFIETLPNPIKCFTRRKPDLMMGKTLQITGTNGGGEKVMKNIIDGVYNRQGSTCYCSSQQTNPFVTLDLGEVVDIQSVTIWIMPEADGNFEHVRVKVGDVELGYYPDKAEANSSMTITRSKPISGQFISIIRETEGGSKLGICHLEIF